MKLIFCIDDKKGMMFFGKRQSQDSVLREWIISHTTGSNLWMSNYSAKQFKGYALEGVSEIILCHWNRKYQADRVFDIDLKANGFKKVGSEDIKGSSHDKITIETYRKG